MDLNTLIFGAVTIVVIVFVFYKIKFYNHFQILPQNITVK